MGSRSWSWVILGCASAAGLVFFLIHPGAEPTGIAVSGGFPKAAPGDWPWWRGPMMDGTNPEPLSVTQWSASENVLWKTPLPGRGHSSPIICGSHVFLTTAEEETQKQLLLAFDRRTGKLLWTTVIHEGGFSRKHQKNSHASATPAYDGDKVYSVFLNSDALHVTATNLDGKILWQTRAGAFQPEHGYGSSPVLYGSLVIINGDSLKGCFLAALDRATGKVVWRTERKTTGVNGSYGTPVVSRVVGKPQLLLSGMGEVSGYDPETGKRLWWCTGPADITGSTVAFSDDLAFASGGYPRQEVLAVRADGTGDVTPNHVVWSTRKGVAYVPSPLYHDGYLYVQADSGMATCWEAATGKQIWQERLEGGFTASPVLAGELMYVTNEAGRTYVLQAGPKFKQVAVNNLKEGIMATLVPCGGQLFLRSDHHLYCIGKPEAKGR